MWSLGNLREVYQGQAAEADLRWQAQHGNVVRFKGAFGVCKDIRSRGNHVLMRWSTGRRVDDFGPGCSAVHFCKVWLSVPQSGRAPRSLDIDQRKRNYISQW